MPSPGFLSTRPERETRRVLVALLVAYDNVDGALRLRERWTGILVERYACYPVSIIDQRPNVVALSEVLMSKTNNEGIYGLGTAHVC